ncbi:MAG: hypothetical protein A2W05_08665 [Candidatus Schekmanbacteria bacterium RBG_16_38_10]|uniref:Cytotoxin n=1 Tax=Candidatus Schekmanbacteria bacterium RBG_16_38_10 TaxID=1817879 RepID=A0A1F7RUR0_9BACT|nr:MAG: hypothetical protein A2W05_08665 [Candidatus Schekmanbacteria bacterium RBG_16_38_10]
MHPLLKKKVRAALDEILNNSSAGKALRRELEGLSSLRVGQLRIIYRVTSQEYIEIVAIGPRKVIYEETYRLIKKSQKSQV